MRRRGVHPLPQAEARTRPGGPLNGCSQQATGRQDSPQASLREIGRPVQTESRGGAFFKAWRAQSPEERRVSRAAARVSEKHRLAVCAATRAAVGAGVYEVPPRAGSLFARRALDDLLSVTRDGRELLAEAERHTGGCYRRVPGRPPSVTCSCRGAR